MRTLPLLALAVLAVLAPSTAVAATPTTTTPATTTPTSTTPARTTPAGTTTTPATTTPTVDPFPRRIPVGLSDQNPHGFADPLFAPLGIRYGRYVTPWNVALDPAAPAALELDEWLAAARAAGVSPLISFEHLAAEDCPRAPCVLPSQSAYRAAIRAFRTRYPQVTALSPWNEANHPTQPTYKKPEVAASYYRIVAAECPTCQVVAADVLDMTNMEKWLTAFVKAAPEARLWGMHNYGDANRFRTSGLAIYLKVTKGSIWLTETGAITAFTTTAGVVTFKKSDTRAAKAMTYLFSTLIPLSNRVKRVYIYNWGSDPANRWDTGLVDYTGKARKVYEIVKSYSVRG